MDRESAGAFVYAKASGILGHSFIGSRTHLLFEQKSLSGLWTMIFKTPVPIIPEVMLAEQIESEAFTKFISEYKYFVKCYDKPDPLLIDQLCIYEAENLKEVSDALSNGQKTPPALVDLEGMTKLDFTAWPDIAKITKDTPYSWYNRVPDVHEQQKMEFKLDLQVIRHLWNSVIQKKGEIREVLLKIYENEYTIKNIIWALRLRIYYKMAKEDIADKLIYVTDKPSSDDPIAGPALSVLDMPLDNYETWSNWKYKDLINPYVEGEPWEIDPTWIENRNRVVLNRLSLKVFHQYPMTECSLIGWYKIKKYELRCIRTAVESLRLNINASEAMSSVGISTDGGAIYG
ncbi:V-type ATPase subunit [Treponema sp. Marseille-Q3903]|uniref:V0D/AC39 family V-type ATPase subunit n=1 Tax=Treponema sp. Marseille-Q3903 TaxID=2766703 RepID=UPI001652AAA7|nr:V-type ATPase subunit [Treponema sp. Marseille-Q3903]MBC6714191.1 V-type ATPase subunit [Treponema sp. Marseille-Q3903]